jgi:hypothetical protein
MVVSVSGVNEKINAYIIISQNRKLDTKLKEDCKLLFQLPSTILPTYFPC